MIALSILNRLLLAVVTLFGVAVVVFVLLRVVPGDPKLLKVTTRADLELVESWL